VGGKRSGGGRRGARVNERVEEEIVAGGWGEGVG